VIAMSARGDFEVVWGHYFSSGYPVPQGIFARHFDRQGRPTQAAPIKLDAPSFGSSFPESSFVKVVALPGSGYFVTWFERRNSRADMVGRFLGATGRPRGPALRLAALRSPGDRLCAAIPSGRLRLGGGPGCGAILRPCGA
jgi:hypothetical protein